MASPMIPVANAARANCLYVTWLWLRKEECARLVLRSDRRRIRSLLARGSSNRYDSRLSSECPMLQLFRTHE